VWARLATRGSPFANGDTLGVMIASESGALPAVRNLARRSWAASPSTARRLMEIATDPSREPDRMDVTVGIAAARRRRISFRRIPPCATISRPRPCRAGQAPIR